MKKWMQLLTVAAMLGVGAEAFAATMYIREQNTVFNGNAVVTTNWDDTWVTVSGGVGSATNNAGQSNYTLRSSGVVDRAIVAQKNLFTLLPKTSGGDTIEITSAVLHLYANSGFGGVAGSSVSVNRMTTNWLPQAAGSNEGAATGALAKNTATTVPWAAGPFSTADYDTTVTSSLVWNATTTNRLNSITITPIIQAIYNAEQNYGFVLSTNSTGIIQIRTSEFVNTPPISPVLEINYNYVAAVPEPATASLAMLSGLCLLARRWK